MLINLFNTVKSSGVPCSLRELLDLIGALEARIAYSDMNDFYYLSRAILVKDEKHYDKFDRAFEIYFKGMEKLEDIFAALIPEDWLRKEFEKQLTEEELKEIQSLGGLEKLLEEFKKRLDEQKERHEGGNKWVGTAGTSPFGNSGNNPEGIRVGGKGGGGNAVKVWEQRQYKNLDDSVLIGTRNIKMALRRLRKFARQSNNMELDMSGTIKNTAKNGGILDINMLPERTNAVKVLIFFDVGGSMDPYVKVCEELFSAVKTELKNLEKLNIDYVIHSNRQISFLEEIKSSDLSGNNKIWLKIDTGMNRLGFKENEIFKAFKKIELKPTSTTLKNEDL